MNHHTIKQAFDQRANQYDQHAMLQQHIGLELIGQLDNKRVYSRAIDLGCGTGMTTAALAQAIHFKRFSAIDLAPNAIRIARAKLKPLKIKTHTSNFDQLIAPINHFDLIFASMSLQWSLHLADCFKHIYRCLKPGGQIAFSLPLDGSLHELSTHYGLLKLPSMASLDTIQRTLHFKQRHSQQQTYTQIFATKLEAFQSIKNIGANRHNQQARHPGLSRQELTKKNINSLTYNIAYMIWEK